MTDFERLGPANSGDLARLFDVDDEASPWPVREWPAIWRHQLAAPLANRLGSVGGALRAARPDVYELGEIKNQARAAREEPGKSLPAELATALYYAAIAAALCRLGERISRLPDAKLAEGFAWGAERTWTDPDTRELFLQAIEKLSTGLE